MPFSCTSDSDPGTPVATWTRLISFRIWQRPSHPAKCINDMHNRHGEANKTLSSFRLFSPLQSYKEHGSYGGRSSEPSRPSPPTDRQMAPKMPSDWSDWGVVRIGKRCMHVTIMHPNFHNPRISLLLIELSTPIDAGFHWFGAFPSPLPPLFFRNSCPQGPRHLIVRSPGRLFRWTASSSEELRNLHADGRTAV